MFFFLFIYVGYSFYYLKLFHYLNAKFTAFVPICFIIRASCLLTPVIYHSLNKSYFSSPQGQTPPLQVSVLHVRLAAGAAVLHRTCLHSFDHTINLPAHIRVPVLPGPHVILQRPCSLCAEAAGAWRRGQRRREPKQHEKKGF